jgi:hypothetical protein
MIDDFADAGVPVSLHYVEPGCAIREADADAYDLWMSVLEATGQPSRFR